MTPAQVRSGRCGLTWVAMGVSTVYEGCTNCFDEICVTVPPARPRGPRGGGTPDDRASKPDGAATSACRRTARDQGEQGQERRRGGRCAEVVAVQDQPV